MKKCILTLAFAVFLLSGCVAPITVNPLVIEQPEQPSPSIIILVETGGNRSEMGNAVPQEETDPEGKRIAHPSEPGYFPLLAMIRDEGLYLYGINNQGMILYQNDRGTYFDWPRVGAWYPQLEYHDFDFDSDNEKELAILLTMGTGTGRHVMDLHILKIEENPCGVWFTPIYTDYLLSAYNVIDWMTEPIVVTLFDEENMFIVDICGVSYTGDAVVWNSEAQKENIFAGVSFGDIVVFYFEGTQIRVKIAVRTLKEDSGLNMNYFGDIHADVAFDGESFRLENYTFVLNLKQ